MSQIISGPGVGLPYPQKLYPTELNNAPADSPTNYAALAPGDALPVPAGFWMIDIGKYCVLQYLDPVSGIWRQWKNRIAGPQMVRSDGFTVRVANLTNCVVGARVLGGGSNYAQASTTVSASAGGSEWQPIVGGQVSVTAVGTTVAGLGYGVAPILFIPAPPNPGVQATAKATLDSGTGSIASVTLTNVGAGYTTAPAITVIPNPTDPNIDSITAATLSGITALVNSGAITAALCTNSGNAVGATSVVLTASGVGSGATLSAVTLQSVTAVTVDGAGVGYGAPTTPALVTSAGGGPVNTAAYVNPEIEFGNFAPRPLNALGSITATSISAVSVIFDGGLFAVSASSNPTPAIVPGGGGIPTAAATLSFTLGGQTDTVLMQPL